MGLVISVIFSVIVIYIAVKWTDQITEMMENDPDYKGEDFLE